MSEAAPHSSQVRAPAILAAFGLHAVILGLVLVAVGTHRLPDPREVSAMALVFEPQPMLTAAELPQLALVQPAEPPLPTFAAPLPEPPAVPDLAQPPLPSPTMSSPAVIEPLRPVVVARPSPPRPKPQQQVARPPAAPPPPSVATVEPRTAPAAAPSLPARVEPAPAVAAVSDDWRRALIGWLQAHKAYPQAGRMSGAEGRVLVQFTANRDGRVIDVSLAQSSGYGVLDDAAVALLRGAQLPAFPAGMAPEIVKLTVPLNYRLD